MGRRLSLKGMGYRMSGILTPEWLGLVGVKRHGQYLLLAALMAHRIPNEFS